MYQNIYVRNACRKSIQCWRWKCPMQCWLSGSAAVGFTRYLCVTTWCVCVCVYIYRYLCVLTCGVYTHTQTHVYTNKHICMIKYICVRIHIVPDAIRNRYVVVGFTRYLYVYLCVYTYIYMCIHIYKHVSMQGGIKS